MTGMSRIILTVGATTAACIAAVHACKSSFIDTYRVTNESMLPYLTPQANVIIRKTSPCLRIPFTQIRFGCTPCETGRAYVFRNPQNPGQKLVKFAQINLFTRDLKPGASNINSARSCYFEGSNKENSVDSRHFGAVPFENIEGKVIYPIINYTEGAASLR
jgi:hypothetical protein